MCQAGCLVSPGLFEAAVKEWQNQQKRRKWFNLLPATVEESLVVSELDEPMRFVVNRNASKRVIFVLRQDAFLIYYRHFKVSQRSSVGRATVL